MQSPWEPRGIPHWGCQAQSTCVWKYPEAHGVGSVGNTVELVDSSLDWYPGKRIFTSCLEAV